MRIRAGNSSLEHIVQATAGRNIFGTAIAGTLELAKGPTVLEMEAGSVVGQEMMLLHRVWLRATGG